MTTAEMVNTQVINCHQGRRDHYWKLADMLKRDCRSIFLMQRSSTLLLGPEYGWDGEGEFYRELWERISAGVPFQHIVNLDGLVRHLARTTSVFPQTGAAYKRLQMVPAGARRMVGCGPDKLLLKKIPVNSRDPDLKFDRQARTLIVERSDGEVEGMLIVDVGPTQVSFHIRGPKMSEFLRSCRAFYRQCVPLYWDELPPVSAGAFSRVQDVGEMAEA